MSLNPEKEKWEKYKNALISVARDVKEHHITRGVDYTLMRPTEPYQSIDSKKFFKAVKNE